MNNNIVKKAITYPAITAISVSLSLNAFGMSEEEKLTAEKVSELSFDELLDFNVSVASSRPESIPETPAIVSRYDAADLKKMGVRDLKGFLSMVPGMDVINSFGTSVVSIRGIYEGFNQKVLFLLNGVPYFMPSHSDVPLLGVPLESISHIEVIRGPGAVYHGTNASGGVINVVTKDEGESAVKLTAGNRSLVNSSGYFAHSFSEDTSMSIAYEVQQTDGYLGYTTGASPHPFIPDLDSTGYIPRGDEMQSVLFKLHHGNANFMLQTFSADSKVLAGFTSLVSHTINEQSGVLLHADYDLDFERAAIKFYADYNQYTLALPTERQGPGTVDGGTRFEDDNENNKLRIGISGNYRITDNLDWYSVVETESRETGSYELFNGATGDSLLTIMEGSDVGENSFATQLDYSLNSWRFLIGGRYTDNELAGGEFTPRLSAVYSIDESQSLKLLYAGGFNSPNIIQQKLFVPGVVVGNEDLKAESVRTSDIVYTKYSANSLFSANAYYLEAKDFIERAVTPDGISYFNSGNFTRYGVEFDYQYSKKKWQFIANMGYLKQGDSVDVKDGSALFVPKLTLSGGASYQINDMHSLGASVRFLGERNGIGRSWVSNLDYRFSYGSVVCNLTVRNAANELVMHPDVTNLRAGSTLQSLDKSNVLVGVKYNF